MTATTPTDAELSLDRFLATTGDAPCVPRPLRRSRRARWRAGGGQRPKLPTVSALADAEVLMALPAMPYPATERRHSSLARFASLPSPFTLAEFDFSAQPSVDPKLIARFPF